jgi:N-acetylmuramoyl-L-alanine amidase
MELSWASTLLFLLLVQLGCEKRRPYIIPEDLSSEELRNETIKHFSKSLSGKIILIDPGHGGDRINAKEAQINLRVGCCLKEFFTSAKATVYLTRCGDSSVSLMTRLRTSEQIHPDCFISIHHNSSEDPDRYYSSTWYHSREGSNSYSAANYDLARYIQRDLSFALRISGSPNTFDGTGSDYDVFPNEGFHVLRNMNVPSVLVECTFFSSSFEQQRLEEVEFNQLEAWGIFCGVGKYFAAGVPRIEMDTAKSHTMNNGRISIIISDVNGIIQGSVRIHVDTILVSNSNMLFTAIGDSGYAVNIKSAIGLKKGIHLVRVDATNKNGNSAIPFVAIISIR